LSIILYFCEQLIQYLCLFHFLEYFCSLQKWDAPVSFNIDESFIKNFLTKPQYYKYNKKPPTFLKLEAFIQDN
jgi:hypothetical protein